MIPKLSTLLQEITALSKKDAKDILADIETGKGRIAKIMQKKPELQAQMTQGLPNKIDGWRAVAAMGSLRSEKIVSLSTNFDGQQILTLCLVWVATSLQLCQKPGYNHQR
jgi:hypothetical protein